MNSIKKGSGFKRYFSWSSYNRALSRRGEITLYVASDVSEKWRESENPVKNIGRPRVYPDAVIALALIVQQVYRQPLRQTVGLMRSVMKLGGINLPVPDSSTLCRRRREIVLPSWPKAGACIVIDSTGLQIRGPNTWLTTVHGEQRRTYRKIHLGIDPESSFIVAGVVTPCQTHDSEALDSVLDTAEADASECVIGDGAYDRRCCYAAARKRKLRLVTPPGSRAILHRTPGWEDRDRAVEESRFLGRRNWKISHGYGRRSLAEAAMHRLKAAFGPALRSRAWANQRHEALLRAHILNSWPSPKRLSLA